MQVSDKLIRPLTEAKYLNADNVSRYRCIMRIFFEHYEKLKYWLYQEEVYEEMIQDPFFADYRMEQCQQDLMMLTEWKNLNTIQDTKKVASIEEFKNKKYRYQMTEYSVEIERLVIRLENMLQWMKRMFVWGMHFANYRSSLFQTIWYHLSRSISMIYVLIRKHGASILVKVCLNM